MATVKREVKTIDAAGKSIGRLASDIACFLQGKHRASYTPHIDAGDMVEVRNCAKMKITGKKLSQKTYYHFSGYPGGMKSIGLQAVMAKNPSDALRRAVRNMLPKNRQQKDRLKRLKLHND